jgi:UDPglucose 6-dehydrogenase
MSSLGIIGGGVLGKAAARGFMEHCEVRLYDIVKEKASHTLEEAATADIVFVCLPTPALPDGRCDTRLIDEFLHEAFSEQWWRKESCYVIRSTVPVGYTDRKFCEYMRGRPLFHSPEFLTARCSVVDFQTPSRNIIGNPPVNINTWTPEFHAAYERLAALYAARFPGVPLLVMQSNASELVKLACNTFFAAKVSMFNLFAEIATAAGVDWEAVRGGILSDGRIAHAHTLVTSPAPGYGGTCLPKDTADLFHVATGAGIDAELLRAVHERNERIRRPHDPELARIELPGVGSGSCDKGPQGVVHNPDGTYRFADNDGEARGLCGQPLVE